MPTEPYVIVVGTDYSKASERALQTAYEHARRHAPAELHVVHVSLAGAAKAPATTPHFPELGTSPVLTLEEQSSELVKHLDALIPSLPGFREAKVRIIAHVVLDAPVFGVTRLASDLQADSIVVGSHGRHGVARWLLGSVAEGVVRQTTCPVLVVPPASTTPGTPEIEPPCSACVAARKASQGHQIWCEQHSQHHGRRHTYYQPDRGAAETNLPLVMR